MSYDTPPIPTVQCKAKAKSTGRRCQCRAMYGQEVCNMHGGMAPQNKRKAQERITQAELLAQARADPALTDATPAEMLLHAAKATHAVVRMLQEQGAGRAPDPVTLDLFGAWLDRVTRSADVVIRSKAAELVIAEQSRIAEGQARQIAEVMNRVLNALGLTPTQAAKVPDALGSALASLGLIPKPTITERGDSSGERNLAAIEADLGALI